MICINLSYTCMFFSIHLHYFLLSQKNNIHIYILLHFLPNLLPLGFLQDKSCPTECCEADAVEQAFRPDLSVSSISSDAIVLKQMSTCSTPESKYFLVKQISIFKIQTRHHYITRKVYSFVVGNLKSWQKFGLKMYPFANNLWHYYM